MRDLMNQVPVSDRLDRLVAELVSLGYDREQVIRYLNSQEGGGGCD